MKITVVEPWVRFLREIFSRRSDGGQATVPVQVSIGFPFTDLPENANLPNSPGLADTSSRGVVRVANRRSIVPPEITVHDAGENIPKKYMDNFVSYVYSRDIKINPIYHGKIAKIKNVLLENADGSLTILEDGKDYRYSRHREVIAFNMESFGLVPVGSRLKYIADLYYKTSRGETEIIESGEVVDGEMIAVLYSLETDVTLQIDLWGGDTKQTEWLLQRFRYLWVNEKWLRQSLAGYGLINMNLSWSHTGINTHLDKRFRPYLYNITCNVQFTTEYRTLEVAKEYYNQFDQYYRDRWLGAVVPAIDGVAVREYFGSLSIAPYGAQYIISSETMKMNRLIVKS
jgi:hypothetical protein